MQNATEIGIFERERAEVPHTAGAITLTDSSARWPAAAEVAQPDETDELVSRAKAGDASALHALLAAARPRAMAAALKVLHNPDDAEDAVQDAFMKIWRCLGAFEGRSAFGTWLHRIVTNASLDLLRRNSSRGEFVDRTDTCDDSRAQIEHSSDVTPESQLAQREVQHLVRTAVAALPPAHRQAVELREFEDCSYEEMADIIHCPIGTVMSRLHHARGKLASQLAAPFERFAA